MFRSEGPFLVFVDLAMPAQPVIDLLSTISEEAPDTVVILLSPNSEVPQVLPSVDVHAFDCLSKPITPSAVEHAVRHAQFQANQHEASRAHVRYLERRNVQLDVRMHELEKLGILLEKERHERARLERTTEGKASFRSEDEVRLLAIQAALDSAGDAFLITDKSGCTVYANAAFQSIFGLQEDTDAPFALGELFVNPGVVANMKENVDSLGTFSCEVPMVAKDRGEFHALVRATAIGGGPGLEMGRLYIFSDITEQENFRQQAYHDALTGLYSRRHFIELLEQNMSLARRHNHPLSLCLCDLDQFKGVNDTYGHQMGDEVLKSFSRIISQEIRTEDIAGRIGGDEFCLLFPHVSAEVAAICLERIRSEFSALAFTPEIGQAFSASATFGIADLAEDMAQEEFLVAADQSLYKGKQLGGDRSVVNMEP